MIFEGPPAAGSTVVHVEDEAAFEYLLAPLFRHKGLHYQRVSLLSEALEFLEEPGIVGFIFDLRLPQEAPFRFAGWAGYERTPEGLIRRIRSERPDLTVVVLTDYPDDTPLRRLLQSRIMQTEDIFKKSDQSDKSLEALVARFER